MSPKSALYRYAYGYDDQPPGIMFKLVGAVALAAVIAGLLIAVLTPARVPRLQPDPRMAAAFDAVARENVRVIPLPRKPAPIKVTTTIEEAAPLQDIKAEPVQEPEQSRPDDEHARHAEVTDICARHGLHKVITDHGRGWRCRR